MKKLEHLSPIEILVTVIEELDDAVKGNHKGIKSVYCLPGCHQEQLNDWLYKLELIETAIASGRDMFERKGGHKCQRLT